MGVWLHKSSHRFHGFAQMVGCVCSPTDFTDQHRWLVALILPRNSQNSQKFWGAVGCVGMAGCHTLLHLCKSVPICGRYFSARRFRAFRGFCGNIVSHGFHRSTQMVCCVNSPTEFTEFTEVWGCCWQRGYGRMPYPPNLCKSVLSVGDSSLPETSVLSVGSVGGASLPEGSVLSVRSVGGVSQPEECVPWATTVSRCGSV